MWEEVAIAHEEHHMLAFSAWGERNIFCELEWLQRKAERARARVVYDQLKPIFRTRTSFLHSVNFIRPIERNKHWPPPGTTYAQLQKRSSKIGGKDSPFFSTVRFEDIQLVYWALVPIFFRIFFNEGLSDRAIELPFPIGFSQGIETALIHLRMEGNNVHAHPTGLQPVGVELVKYDDLSIRPYLAEFANLRQRCFQFAN